MGMSRLIKYDIFHKLVVMFKQENCVKEKKGSLNAFKKMC